MDRRGDLTLRFRQPADISDPDWRVITAEEGWILTPDLEEHGAR